jgi:hypothetical protein
MYDNGHHSDDAMAIVVGLCIFCPPLGLIMLILAGVGYLIKASGLDD